MWDKICTFATAYQSNKPTMAKILKVRKPSDYSSWVGQTDRHPLVSVIDYGKVSPIRHSLNDYSVYGIFLRDDEAVIGLKYGYGDYDYKKGTLMCVAPGQIGGKEDDEEIVSITGWALLFHPDLLHGTPLEKEIRRYSFFDYRVNEALHMTDEEKDIVVGIMQQISNEIENSPKDDSQDSIIVGLIGVLLNYCQRFYNRQFLTRKLANSGILSKFDNLLKDYFGNNIQKEKGLPTVQYFADTLCMSANYLGDVIKRISGETAGNYIRRAIIQEAKNRLAAGLSISETAYDLGFEYPQHFSRMFKKCTSISPQEYLKKRNKR
jgi:AraC-like DNA-binding protein